MRRGGHEFPELIKVHGVEHAGPRIFTHVTPGRPGLFFGCCNIQDRRGTRVGFGIRIEMRLFRFGLLFEKRIWFGGWIRFRGWIYGRIRGWIRRLVNVLRGLHVGELFQHGRQGDDIERLICFQGILIALSQLGSLIICGLDLLVQFLEELLDPGYPLHLARNGQIDEPEVRQAIVQVDMARIHDNVHERQPMVGACLDQLMEGAEQGRQISNVDRI